MGGGAMVLLYNSIYYYLLMTSTFLQPLLVIGSGPFPASLRDSETHNCPSYAITLLGYHSALLSYHI